MSRLLFHYEGTSESGKTKKWVAFSGSIPLGWVTWFAHWRRYTFTPLAQTTFDADCLAELSDFVRRETGEHNVNL